MKTRRIKLSGERRHTESQVPALEFVNDISRDSGARGPKRVTNSNGAAVKIALVHIQSELKKLKGRNKKVRTSTENIIAPLAKAILIKLNTDILPEVRI